MSSTTIPTDAAGAARSTIKGPLVYRAPQIGDQVFVQLDTLVTRPMLVSGVSLVDGQPRLSGTIFCQPEDHTCPAFRYLDSLPDPARLHGRPERLSPFTFGTDLAPGRGYGQWRTDL